MKTNRECHVVLAAYQVWADRGTGTRNPFVDTDPLLSIGMDSGLGSGDFSSKIIDLGDLGDVDRSFELLRSTLASQASSYSLILCGVVVAAA